MAIKTYTTKTASLRVTNADIRNLDVKKINLDGKNILEYIKESVPTIKHSQDTRETVYEDDLWGQWVETKDDGTVVVHDDYLSNPNSSSTSAWLSNVKAVQDNKAYSEITTDSEGNFTGVVEDSVIANIQTERIKDGNYIFYWSPITSFNGDLSSLVNGEDMFSDSPLESFSGDLSNLVNGSGMFSATSLEQFNGDLSSLVNGEEMFYNTSLTSFSCDLGSLVNGSYMFRNTSLEQFNGDLCNLVNGSSMFYNTSLASFSSDLSSLVDGENMFSNISSLTSFSGDLSSLINGFGMFFITKLTPQSVMYIVESIRNITEEKAKYTSGEIPWVTKDSTSGEYSASFGFMEDGSYVYTLNNPNATKPFYTLAISSSDVGLLTLGIDVTNDSDTIEQQLQTFAEGCLCDSWEELKQEFVDKGWTVTFQYGGTGTSITYGLRDGEQIIPCPIFAKLVEADKDSAEYCTEDASAFYNIEWGHDVTDTSSYTQFNSLEDAMTSWNVFPKENIITTEE